MNSELKVGDKISNFVSFVEEAKKLYNLYSEKLTTQDKLTQDLLHSLELDKLTDNDKRKLATKLRTCRKDRRYYKDRIEELEPLIQVFKESSNRVFLNSLSGALNKVRNAERYHKNRTYVPKVVKYEEKLEKESKKVCKNVVA